MKRRALVGLLLATTFLGCSNYDFVTFDVGLPSGARVVASKSDTGFRQDARTYLIFDTDAAGAVWFAERYSGVDWSDFHRSRTKLNGAGPSGTWADRVEGIPWDLTLISNGRFFRRDDTNGFLSIDMDTYRVYVFR